MPKPDLALLAAMIRAPMESMTVTVIRKNIAGPTIGLLALAVMSLVTGCASRPYPKGGDGQPGMVIFVPFILANEVALYAIEKKKQTAAEAHEAELLSQVHRFEELRALAVKGDAAIQCELAFCYLRGRGAIRDVRQATFWFQQSARQGFAEAQNELGLGPNMGSGRTFVQGGPNMGSGRTFVQGVTKNA